MHFCKHNFLKIFVLFQQPHAGIGYHFYIRRDGAIYRGRPEDMQGAHAYGANHDSIGVCFEGDLNQEYLTQEQINSGREVVQYLRKEYGNIEFTEHRKVCNTSCPGKNFNINDIINGQPVENKPEEPTQTNENEHIDILNDGKINCIYDIQEYLNRQYGVNIAQDNIFGQATKKALVKALQTEFNKQYNAGLIVDGIYGTKTRGASKIVCKNAEGNITMLIQMALFIKGYNIDMDKKFGANTERIVGQFQKDNGLVADGIVGANTFEKLFG